MGLADDARHIIPHIIGFQFSPQGRVNKSDRVTGCQLSRDTCVSMMTYHIGYGSRHLPGPTVAHSFHTSGSASRTHSQYRLSCSNPRPATISPRITRPEGHSEQAWSNNSRNASTRHELITCQHSCRMVIQNKHSTDVEIPAPPPRVCIRIDPEGHRCVMRARPNSIRVLVFNDRFVMRARPMSGRVLVINDPPARRIAVLLGPGAGAKEPAMPCRRSSCARRTGPEGHDAKHVIHRASYAKKRGSACGG
jgi:hypothetical protein